MALYHEGKALLDEEKFEEAEKRFEQGLEEGDIRCCYGLLAVNAIQKKECDEIIRRFQNAKDELLEMAEKGDGDACFIIGRCHETGMVLEADIRKAVKYYRMAAEKQNTDAMFNMGCIYMQVGEGGSVVAKEYFMQAAELGNSFAKRTLIYMQETEKQ